ncbi:MAG TPA: carboxypeptidase regulatory-like domain-containing protein, partial [Vicinamibacterales bacterium]|nr:carboxypeptidase regulatory-like domain-containing protein [Vicinamibacterales bacterium]
MSHLKISYILIASLWLALVPSRSGAQTVAAMLIIQPRDAEGAAVGGVTITITDQQTGNERRVVTGADGAPIAMRLAPGAYTVTGSREGFKTPVLRDVHVESASRGTVILLMSPGDLTEHIVVIADASTVRIGTGTVATVFDANTMLALPVSDREALAFAVQAPGVAPPAPGSRLSTQGNTGVNGGGAREAANNFLLDGVDNNDQFLNRLVINPTLDGLEQVDLLRNTYDAEYGRSAGLQVAMVSKSGTGTWHGSAYEFFRDSTLDARNPFQPANDPKPLLQRHEFGGTLGGPLRLPRSFFFASAEGIRGRDADTRLAHVPTAAERRGIFTGAARIRDPLTGALFPGNAIPVSRLDPAGLAAVNLYPLPNREDPQANFVSSPVAERRAMQFTLKTDHTLWSGSPASLRYSFSRDNRSQPFPVRGRNLPGFGIAIIDQGQNFSFGIAKPLSSRAVNELRVGINALHRENLPQRAGTDGFSALGIIAPRVTASDLGFPTLVVPGYETLGDDPNLPVVRRTRTVHLTDVFAFDRSRHYFKAGGEFRSFQSDGYNHLFARGQATFAGAFTGNPVADLLLGLPTVTLLGVNDNRQALRTWALNGFVQDDWRVNWKLTVNAGLRYEYNAPPYDADDRMRILDLATLQLRPVGTDGVSRSGLEGDFNNVAPRVGFAFDPTGYGKWLVRGGYGIYYD